MRSAAKTKPIASRLRARKSALSATAAARRIFPAWIDADERVVSFAAAAAQPRVRDALVLRKVAKKKSAGRKGTNHGSDAR
ncbi:MAG: hypothetical protein Q7S40_10925 [Opitutaceae bacterium]|nr:hypothetical protein [Opitutaceae bacterium]